MKENVYDIKRIIKRRTDYFKNKNKNIQERYERGIFMSYMHLYRDIEGMDEAASRNNAKKTMNSFNHNKKIIIPRLVVNITDRCTLKCKECAALIPYLKQRGEAKSHLVIEDLDKIFNVIDECLCIEFIGGEPLLYNELEELLQYAQKNEKIKVIEITTNATIIPNNALTQVLKNKRTLVQISEYKGVEPQKIEELQCHLEKNNIKYKVLKMDRWYAYGDTNKRGRSKKELEYSYYYCNDNKMCRTLYAGKLFVCGRAAALYSLGGCLTDASSYLEIRKNENITGNDLLNFYRNHTYAEACDFCDISRDDLKSIAVAEQL
jgi:organic radical activating enzyme